MSPYEERVEYGIWAKRTGGYYVKVSIHGTQKKHPVDTIEEARALRDQLVQQRIDAGGRSRNHVYTPDRLPLPQPQEGEPVATDLFEEPEIKIPEALRPAYDALIAQRDEMEDNAAPLREALQTLDAGLERVQAAIDALEGKEPDAAAEFRQPGALADRLSAKQREPFRVGLPRRPQMSRADSRRLKEVIYDVMPIGEENQVGRAEITQFAAVKFDRPITKDQVSSQLKYLIEDGLVARNSPDNPKDIRYWRVSQPPEQS